MVALGLFGCIEAARRFEVYVKLRALLIGRFIKGFISLMQRNLAFHDFFRKIGGFKFKFNRCYFVRCNIVYMYYRIKFVSQRR